MQQPLPYAWTKGEFLDFFRDFLFKEHFEEVEERIGNLGEYDAFWGKCVPCEVIKRTMNKCNGALDVYGSDQYISQHFENFWLSVSREERLVRIVINSFRRNIVLPGDQKLIELLLESIKTLIERQLAGSYEIIPKSVYQQCVPFRVPRGIENWSESEFVNWQKKTAEWTKDPSLVFPKLSELFVKEHDQKLLAELRKWLSKAISKSFQMPKSRRADFFNFVSASYYQFREAKNWVLRQIQNNPTFQPFSNRKSISMKYTKSRLFLMEDEKFLFAKDVEYAIRRELDNENYLIPEGLLEVESEEERDSGTYFTISYNQYLELPKKLKLDPDSITLLNSQVVLLPHITAPIISPYGTRCKPAVDVFNELLGVLTLVLQVWQRIKPKKLAKLEEKISEVCQLFMDDTKPPYFIECGRIEQLGEHLRNAVKPLIEQTPAPKPMKLFNTPTEELTLSLLRVGAEKLKLTGFYSNIHDYFQLCCAKHKKFHQKTHISQCELTMMIQHCVALCLAHKIPLIGSFICSQKSCRRFGLSDCPCSRAGQLPSEDRSSYTPAGVTDEGDYEMKFTCFPDFTNCFSSLISKSSRQQLVTSSMTQAYIVNNIMNRIRSIHKWSNSDSNFDDDWKRSKCETFYMTASEMTNMSEVIMQKFNSETESGILDVFEKVIRGTANLHHSQLVAINSIISHYCSKYSLSILKDVSSFEKYMPNRIVYLSTYRNPDTNSMCVNSGEFLNALKAKLLAKDIAEARKSWDHFNRLMTDWQTDDGFALISVDLAVGCLNEFPVNPGQFHFVPSVDCVFRDFTRKVSNVIAEVYEEDRQMAEIRNQKYAEEEEEEEFDVDGMCGILESVKKLSAELSRKSKLLREATEEAKELTTAKEEIEEDVRSLKTMIGTQQEQAQGLQRSLDNLKNDLIRTSSLKDEVIKNLEKSLKKSTVENEKEKKKTAEMLKARDSEIEKLRREIAFKSQLDQEIQKMKQQNFEKDIQIENLKNNHNVLYQSISSDLTKCTEEKEVLERRLAEATVTIADLEGQRARNIGADSQETAQRVHQLTGENQCLQSKLRLEKIKYDAIERQNADLFKHIEEIEALLANHTSAPLSPPSNGSPTRVLNEYGPSTSGSSPSTSSPSLAPEPAAPSIPECGICFNEMRKNSRTKKCEVCKTQWHSSCIDKWTSTNPTCPICRRSFPNFKQFPPLRRN